MDILNSIPFTLTQQIDEKYRDREQQDCCHHGTEGTGLLPFLLLTIKKKRIAMLFIRILIRIECFNFDLKHRFLIIFIKSRNRI